MDSQTAIGRIGALLRQAYGPRRQVRRRDNPLDWVIRTLLSQNTTSANSERAYETLRLRFPTFEDMHGAPLRGLISAIRSGGLANQKAVRIKALLEEIWAAQGHFDLTFLRDLSDEEVRAYLGRFKGIGSKTVACVLLFGMGRSAFPVDTHVFRVSRRLGLLNGQHTPEAAQAFLEPHVPPGEHYALHLNLVEHGRRVCRAQRPLCDSCPLARLCASVRT
ncbi:MAG: endonuclease III [candidate division NC10 bacterium]|nr:endonuclease III [candidate division NC10 bacterium]